MNTEQVEVKLTEHHEMQEWRTLMREDGVTCSVDGCSNEANDVHHVSGDHGDNRPENLAPVCKLHHNEVHDITPQMTDLTLLTRQFYSLQSQRMGMAKRIGAYDELGLDVPHTEQALEPIVEAEKKMEKHIQSLVKTVPIYKAWLKDVKGIGPKLAASLIAEIGSPDRFPCVSALWHYCGIHVKDGVCPAMYRGDKVTWNPELKKICYKIGEQFVRLGSRGGLGRELYNEYRAHYEAQDDKRAHFKAKHRATKDFIRCLWVKWREIRNEPLTEPHPNTRIFPEDWIE